MTDVTLRSTKGSPLTMTEVDNNFSSLQSNVDMKANASILTNYATTDNLALKANIVDLTTANVSEVTNLYFTNARSRSALSGGTGVTFDNSTGVISVGQSVGTTNNVTFANVTVTGNLLVQGNAVIFDSNTLAILDPLIQVGKNPIGDAVDLGFFGHYVGGSPNTERHAGLFRDATDGQFKLFTNLDPEPATIVDTANASYQSANLVLNYAVGRVTDISNHSTTDLTEGANLYYTNARVYSNITQTSNLVLNGVATYMGGAVEKANIVFSNVTSNITFNPYDQSVLYYAANSNTNAAVTVNITGLSNLNTGNVLSATILLTNNATYNAYISAVQINGSPASTVGIGGTLLVNGTPTGNTLRWTSTPPTSGSANVELYSFSIFKQTANSHFVIAAKTTLS